MNPRTRSPEDRIFTIPNVISIIRLCFMPVFIVSLLTLHERLFAAYLLAALGVTDGLDGFVARHFNQVTRFGKAIDPIADRVLLVVVIICATIDGSVPKSIVLVSAVREISVIVWAVFVVSHHVPRFGVHWLGKTYTFGLMVAFPLFLGSRTSLSIHHEMRIAGFIVAIPALALGWIAFAIYIVTAHRLARLSTNESVAASVSEHGNTL